MHGKRGPGNEATFVLESELWEDEFSSLLDLVKGHVAN